MNEGTVPQEVNINFTRLGVIIAVLAGVAAFTGAWMILPYRMDKAEVLIADHSRELSVQREILIRIDENVKDLKQRRTP